jgi:hypothetical protein
MLKTYLLVFVFLFIVVQPNIIKMLNSSSLGRLMLISAIIFCTIQNQTAGLALTVLVIAVLNETGPENFDTYEPEEEVEEEEEEKEDSEMIEKKMLTPLSSYNVMPIITPDDIEPDAFSNVEAFSAF